MFGLGIEIGPALDVLSLRVAWKVRRLKQEIAVTGQTFVLKVVDFFLIFLNFFHYPAMEVFLARHAGVGLIDPVAASGIQVTMHTK